MRLPRRSTPAAPKASAESREIQPQPGASAGQVVGSVWAHRALSLALAGCLVAGPIALGWTALSSAAPPAAGAATTAAPATDRSDERAAAGEFAIRVLMAWLRSSQQDPDQLAALVADVPFSSLPRTSYAASEPAVAAVRADGRRTWSVTVAVTMPDAAKKPTRRYFTLPVTVGSGQAAALALPSAVPGPAVMEGARPDYPEAVPNDSPIAQTLTGFLTAYAAGQGDLARFVAPGVSMRAISPPQFTAVTLDRVGSHSQLPAGAPTDGQRLRVLAQATGATAATQTLPLSYAVTLTARAERWEVSALDPVPAHHEDVPAAASSTTNPASPGPAAASTPS